MKKITVFTPTYNRGEFLSRVYGSLLRQSYKDFQWLIIDNSSSDNTKNIVADFIKENRMSIQYIVKPFGGVHTSYKKTFDILETEYMVNIDSDDELTDDCLKVFMDEWNNIESEGLFDIGLISALSAYEDGTIAGGYKLKGRYVDSTYQRMVLFHQNFNEHITCYKVECLKKGVNASERFWRSDEITLLGVGVFWARIGQIAKTRYLNKVLRKYYMDAPITITRSEKRDQARKNTVVTDKFFLDENFKYFLYNPLYFIKRMSVWGAFCRYFAISNKELYAEVNNKGFFALYILLTPLNYFVLYYINHYKKHL